MTNEKKNSIYKEFKNLIKKEGIVIMFSSKRPLSSLDYKNCYKWLYTKIGSEAYDFLPELINALVKSHKKAIVKTIDKPAEKASPKEENIVKAIETPIVKAIYNPKASKVTFEDIEEHFGNAQKRRLAFEKMSETMKIDIILSLSK